MTLSATPAPTPDDVWRLLAELLEAQKETERLSQDNKRELQEHRRLFQEELQTGLAETRRLMREELQAGLAETRQLFREEQEEMRRSLQADLQEARQLFREEQEEMRRSLQTDLQETRRLMREHSAETDRKIAQSNQDLNEKLGKLGNRLGEFVEWQVRPAVVRLFQERQIAVREFHADISVQEENDGIEVDLLVVNGHEAVVVEVKAKLTQLDVDEHLERLSKFKTLIPRYDDVRLLGAVAGMVVPANVARYAYRKGLYVLAQSGDNIVILNDDKFRPQAW